MSATRFLRHNRVDLALHELRAGSGRPLLLLHGLGERSPEHVGGTWAGPVFALDFTGHGASTVPRGGGYSAELLMADVDVALAELGPATVLGRGLGAYIAVLIAGARPDLVQGAVLDDGPGLFGGATGPTSPRVPVAVDSGSAPDPYALLELSADVRPPDYAVTYARHAAERSGLEHPFALTASARPPWLAAVADNLLLSRMSLEEGLARYGR